MLSDSKEYHYICTKHYTVALYRVYALSIMMQIIHANRLPHRSRYWSPDFHMISAAEAKSNTTITIWIFQWLISLDAEFFLFYFSLGT